MVFIDLIWPSNVGRLISQVHAISIYKINHGVCVCGYITFILAFSFDLYVVLYMSPIHIELVTHQILQHNR